MKIFQDEQGNASSARLLLWGWTVLSAYMVLMHHATLDNAVLSFMSGVEMALIGWAGGPRVMQYLGPQIGRITQSIATAKSRFKRDHAEGIQPTYEPFLDDEEDRREHRR